MKLHYLQHVPFEGPAGIESWAKRNGHALSGTRLYAHEPLPNVEDLDGLFVMGGPMNIYQETKHPWLYPEKKFIEHLIARGKIVVGICLGAQLIADVLGSRISPISEKEIGWFPIELTDDVRNSPLFGSWPQRFRVFHWHGDTFELPRGAVRIAYSGGCQNQAFVYGDRVVGLQFHLECTRQGVSDLLENCRDELSPGKYVQTPEEILATDSDYSRINEAMNGMLDQLATSCLGQVAA